MAAELSESAAVSVEKNETMPPSEEVKVKSGRLFTGRPRWSKGHCKHVLMHSSQCTARKPYQSWKPHPYCYNLRQERVTGYCCKTPAFWPDFGGTDTYTWSCQRRQTLEKPDHAEQAAATGLRWHVPLCLCSDRSLDSRSKAAPRTQHFSSRPRRLQMTIEWGSRKGLCCLAFCEVTECHIGILEHGTLGWMLQRARPCQHLPKAGRMAPPRT